MGKRKESVASLGWLANYVNGGKQAKGIWETNRNERKKGREKNSPRACVVISMYGEGESQEKKEIREQNYQIKARQICDNEGIGNTSTEL